MFLHILEFKVENKKNCLGKTVSKIWPPICETVACLSTKIPLDKSTDNNNKKCQQSLVDFGDKTSPSCGFLRPHLQISLSKTIFFCFFTLSSRISRNMCKMCHKLRNA